MFAKLICCLFPFSSNSKGGEEGAGANVRFHYEGVTRQLLFKRSDAGDLPSNLRYIVLLYDGEREAMRRGNPTVPGMEKEVNAHGIHSIWNEQVTRLRKARPDVPIILVAAYDGTAPPGSPASSSAEDNEKLRFLNVADEHIVNFSVRS